MEGDGTEGGHQEQGPGTAHRGARGSSEMQNQEDIEVSLLQKPFRSNYLIKRLMKEYEAGERSTQPCPSPRVAKAGNTLKHCFVKSVCTQYVGCTCKHGTSCSEVSLLLLFYGFFLCALGDDHMTIQFNQGYVPLLIQSNTYCFMADLCTQLTNTASTYKLCF